MRALFVLAMLGALSIAEVALADEPRWQRPTTAPSERAIREARSLFVAGTAAVEAGRWADAVEKFERSYELSGVAAALYNAATALRALGRHHDARDAFDVLLRVHGGDLEDEMKRSAQTLREEEAARVAVLELGGLPPPGELTVRLDGTLATDEGGRPLAIETDAGTHTLRVELPQHEAFLWDGRLRDGEHMALRVQLRRIVLDDRSDDSNFFESPIFWGIAGGVLVVGAVIVGLLLYDAQQLDPLSPNVVELP